MPHREGAEWIRHAQGVCPEATWSGIDISSQADLYRSQSQGSLYVSSVAYVH